jgi:elongation factor 1 alpha-like protein
MASAMPAARALLSDVRPPISDAAIADSLWHYWFDVDKAAGWLRKDWEKKGESGSSVLPNPFMEHEHEHEHENEHSASEAAGS